MTTQTTIPAASQVHQLRFVRGGTILLLDGISNDKLCAQPGSCANHALWIMGHLAATDDYFLKEFSGGKLALPESWHKTFSMNSKPVGDPTKYPSLDEVKTTLDQRHEAWVNWFESLSADDLEKPSPEGWQKYAPIVGDIAHFSAWHEGYHGGQLSLLRKEFGLKPAFG